MAQVIEITLTEEQRQELEAIVARPSEGAGLVRRARVILLSARGVSGRESALRLDPTPEHVSVILRDSATKESLVFTSDRSRGAPTMRYLRTVFMTRESRWPW